MCILRLSYFTPRITSTHDNRFFHPVSRTDNTPTSLSISNKKKMILKCASRHALTRCIPGPPFTSHRRALLLTLADGQEAAAARCQQSRCLQLFHIQLRRKTNLRVFFIGYSNAEVIRRIYDNVYELRAVMTTVWFHLR